MKLEKWALIAEIIGGVAIVLSLIFVGLEIRGNTQVVRAEAYERNIDSINEWRLELIRDPRLVATAGEFYEVFGDDATDEEVERFRLNLLLNTLFGVYEKSYYALQYGILGPDEWIRFESQACLNRARSIEIGLWERMAVLLTREFADHLTVQC